MKKFILSTIKPLCRFSIKTGSVFFLLFFTIFSPIAPAITQIGSVVFLLLLILLSPFTDNKQQLTTSHVHEDPQKLYCQLDEDSPVQEIVILQRSQRQNFKQPGTSASANIPERKIPQLLHFSPGIILYLEKKPEQYYSFTQPVRAGPVTFSA